MEREIISKVAEVARLKLGEEDAEKLGRDFDKILEHLSKLGELKLTQEELRYITPNTNVLRKDVAEECNISLMKNVPKKQDGLIKVPRGL